MNSAEEQHLHSDHVLMAEQIARVDARLGAVERLLAAIVARLGEDSEHDE